MSLSFFTIGLFMLTMSTYDTNIHTNTTTAYIHHIDTSYNILCPAKVSFLVTDNKNITSLMYIPCSASSKSGSNKLFITYYISHPEKNIHIGPVKSSHVPQIYSYKYKIGIAFVTYGIIACICTYLFTELKIIT